ncbi:MAG TPA: transglutaminaseTgpA domain-containing protein [Mycobacteriales bacterium]
MTTSRFGGPARIRATLVAALAVVLGATSLHAVFTTGHWFWPVVLAVAVVGAVGALARRTGLPPVVHLVVALAALLVTVTALYAHRQAWAGFVPTASSVRHLGTLVGDGGTDLRTLLVPTYPTPELLLLTVGGVGVVALAVDLLAVSGRRPTLAGAPLVLLVAVPAAIRERSVGYVSLLLAALGFLLLLTLDGHDRTARWGKVLPRSSDGGVGPSATGTVGPALRIGIAALVAAVAVPFAVPGAHVSRFAASGGDGNGSGGGRAVIVDPLVSVSTELHEQSDEPLLTVKSGIPTYQRITALEQFNDSGFSLGAVTAPASAQVKRGLPAGPYRLPHTEITQRITASDTLAQSLLPVPIGTTDVDIHGDWRLYAPTRTIFSASTNTRGSTWTVTADLPAPSPALLRAGGVLHRPNALYPSSLAVDLQVPNDLPAVVQATAAAWTKGATTAYDAALDIQQHFTSGAFVYDQTVAYVAGPQGFAQFLADRRGFCEQYATTMAAMMRTLGVPARVAIGFTAGTPDRAGNTWTITGADAHAWPEVWFDDAGWVRFEPTPLTDGRALTPSYAGGVGGPNGVTPPPAVAPTLPVPGASASQPAKLDRQPGDRDGGGGLAPQQAGGGIAGWVWAGIGGLVVVLVLLAPMLTDQATRRRRLARGAGAERAWRQLLDDAADRLVAVRPSDSPRMVGGRMRAVLAAGPGSDPAVLAALGRLVAAVEQARYAAPGPDRGPVDSTLATDERTVRGALSRSLPWTRRLVAVITPASARARLVAPPMRAGLVLLAGLDRFGRLFGRRQAPTF